MQPLDYARPQSKRTDLWFWILLALSLGVLATIVAGLFFALRHPADRDERPIRDASNLRQIGQLMLLYANDYHGQYPDRVGLLLEGDDEDAVEGARIFVSPYSNDTPATGPTTHAVAAQMTAGGHVSYVYCGRGFAATASANTVLAYGPLTGWGRNVLFGDGHVERVAPARTNYLLSELAAGNNPPRALSSATAP